MEVHANAYGESITASVVAFRKDGSIIVGNAAKANIIHQPTETVHSAKRLIGRRFESAEVQQSIELCPYEIVLGANDDPRIKIAGKTFTCPEVSGIILREMKRVAEEYLASR